MLRNRRIKSDDPFLYNLLKQKVSGILWNESTEVFRANMYCYDDIIFVIVRGIIIVYVHSSSLI